MDFLLDCKVRIEFFFTLSWLDVNRLVGTSVNPWTNGVKLKALYPLFPFLIEMVQTISSITSVFVIAGFLR